MGNSVTTGVGRSTTNVDMKDINPKVGPVGPLGRRRGRLFTSLHCRYLEDRRDVVVRVLQRAPDDAEQAEIIKRQESIYNAIENRLRAARPANPDEPYRTPRALHLLHYTSTKADGVAVSMERAFVQYSLAERLHARPFLSEQRRLFLVYQLFEALHELHTEFNMSHGDLKSENVLINTVGWLYITDVAPYKPHLIEAFNPANFECYFDSAESRVCTLPPERFTDEVTTASGGQGTDKTAGSDMPVGSPSAASALPALVSPAMKRASSLDGQPFIAGHAIPETIEVFSAGCIAAFIMGDEHPFRLSHVLELRSKATYAERRAYVLEQLQGLRTPLRDTMKEFLVVALIGNPPVAHAPTPAQTDSPTTEDAPAVSPVTATATPVAPAAGPTVYDRPNAVATLAQFTPSVFPRYFAMLHNNIVPTLLSLAPDMQVQFLWTRLCDIIDAAVRCEYDAEFAKAIAMNAAQYREAAVARMTAAAKVKPGTKAASPADAPAAVSAPTSPLFTVDPKRQVAIQADVLDIIMPIVTASLRYLLLEESLLRALFLLEKAGSLCSEDCRRDVIIPILVQVVRGNKPNITPMVRAMALRSLATVTTFVRSLPASECFIFEEYILPAVYAGAKLGAKSNIVCSELPGALTKIMNAAIYIIEEREGLGKAYRSRLDFDAQQDAVVARGWEAMRPAFTHPCCSVLCAALAQVKTLLPLLGLEIVNDGLLPLLTTHLGHSAVEVRRDMVQAAVEVALYLRSPNANATATIVFILEEALREKDARCMYLALIGVQKIIENKALPQSETMRLVHNAIALMAHPSEWVVIAASQLVAAAARSMNPVDVLIHLVDPLKALISEPIPAVLLDRLNPRHFIRPEAILAMADARRRIPSCATYHRQYSHPSSVTIPPGSVPKPLSSVITLDIVDFSVKEVTWIIKTLGLENAVASVTSKQKIALPYAMVKAPEVPFHMSEFSPTPRQLKRLVWRYRFHRKSVAASAVTKVKRGLNIKDSGAASSSALLGLVTAASKQRVPPRPIGSALLADAHAHSGSVTSLASARHWVLSSGSDGLVRLWDLGESLKPNNTQLMVPQTFKDVFGPPTSAAASGTILFTHFLSDEPQSLVAVGSSNGHLRFLDIGAGKAPIVATIEGGTCGGLSSCVSLDNKVVVVGSHRGGLYAVDTRTPSREMWSSSLPRNRGPISKLITISADAPFGILCGTMRGYLAVLDMRFRGCLVSTTLPQASCIYDMVPVVGQNATEGSAPNVAVATATNDVVRIDISTFHETIALKPANTNSIRCLAAGHGGASLFTGGTDGVLRAWNLNAPETSRSILPPPQYSQDYNFNRGAQVIAEVPATLSNTARHANLQGQGERNCHDDAITRLCIASGQGQQFLVSGSRDGAIKVWRNSKAPTAAAVPPPPQR